MQDEDTECPYKKVLMSTVPSKYVIGAANVHQEKDGWYFWDETGCEEMGPYATEVLAEEALASYCMWLIGEAV